MPVEVAPSVALVFAPNSDRVLQLTLLGYAKRKYPDMTIRQRSTIAVNPKDLEAAALIVVTSDMTQIISAYTDKAKVDIFDKIESAPKPISVVELPVESTLPTEPVAEETVAADVVEIPKDTDIPEFANVPEPPVRRSKKK